MEIRNQMGECLIPDNITKRANEIDMFKEKINRITYDFFDFKIEYAKNYDNPLLQFQCPALPSA
jgi:hypothetical protein